MKRIFTIIGLAFSTLYILNPTLGVFEFLPDNLPWIGNIDEATATALAIWCAKELGWYPKFLDRSKKDTKDIKSEK